MRRRRKSPASKRPRSRTRHPSRLRIHLQLHTADTDPPLKTWLPRQLRRLATLEGATRGELTVAVVDNRAMAKLHWLHMKVRGPTDVMTFDLRDASGGDIEGDIVISRDIAAREAKRRAHATRLEVLLYALHGLLHLRGYDDRRAADYRRMHAREDELLRAAGLGEVFNR